MVFAGLGIDKLVVLFEVGQRTPLHHSFVYTVSIIVFKLREEDKQVLKFVNSNIL